MPEFNIKACWSCGHSASIMEVPNPRYPKKKRYTVGCDNETIICMGYQSLTTFETKNDAVIAWNKRAPSEYNRERLEKRAEQKRSIQQEINPRFKKACPLTLRERQVLVGIVDHQPISHADLYALIYETRSASGTTLSVLLSHLRKQLAKIDAKLERVGGCYSFSNESLDKLYEAWRLVPVGSAAGGSVKEDEL